MPRKLSMADIRKGYDRLRRRYFLDLTEDSPFNVPPLAKDLEWGWLPENSDAIGETSFDGDEPVRIRLKARYSDRWTLVQPTLLHELTHIRLGPQYSCGGWGHVAQREPRIARSGLWHKETMRLAAAGAFKL